MWYITQNHTLKVNGCSFGVAVVNLAVSFCSGQACGGEVVSQHRLLDEIVGGDGESRTHRRCSVGVARTGRGEVDYGGGKELGWLGGSGGRRDREE